MKSGGANFQVPMTMLGIDLTLYVVSHSQVDLYGFAQMIRAISFCNLLRIAGFSNEAATD